MHMLTPVRISIIIPTYNREHYLKTAIYSCLQLQYPNFEIIVTDNASTDNTQQMVKQCFNDQRLKYFRNDKNLGAIANIRKGAFDYATGDWFIILSDDDYFVDYQYLNKVNALIQQDSEISLVLSHGYILFEQEQQFIHFNLPYNTIEAGKRVFFDKGRLNQPNYTLCNVVFPTECSKSIMDGFNNPYNGSGDAELFYKLAAYGKVGCVDSASTVYRIHPNNYITQHVKNIDLLMHSIMGPVQTARLARQYNWLSEQDIQQWEKLNVYPWIETVISQIHLSHKTKITEALKFIQDNAAEYSAACNVSTPNTKLRIKYYAYNFPILKLLANILKYHKDQRYRKQKLVNDSIANTLKHMEQQGYQYHA